MDWILEHLQILFLIAVAIVAILQKLKIVRPGEEPGAPPAMDFQEAERTRRIQEAIRRKIWERRVGAPAAPAPSEVPEEPPELAAFPPLIEEGRPIMVPPLAEAIEKDETPDASAGFARQQRMLRELRELQAAQQERAAAAPAAAVDAQVAASGEWLLNDLRTTGGLRRVVLLREILGPPVGLR
jgi:hypothetical protein